MKVYYEKSLSEFDFWSGAKDTAKYLTDGDFAAIESVLNELYPEGMEEMEVNDFFWFEDDSIAEWLGYESFEDLMNEREGE